MAFVHHQSSQPVGHITTISSSTALLGDGGRFADDNETRRQDYYNALLHCAYTTTMNIDKLFVTVVSDV